MTPYPIPYSVEGSVLGPHKKNRRQKKFDFFKMPTGVEQHRAMPGTRASIE